MATGSVSQLIQMLRDGHEDASRRLLNRYLPMLRNRLTSSARGLKISDEDDIAICAFAEFCNAISRNRLDEVVDRSDFWNVMTMIALRKANDFRKYEQAGKRGGRERIVSLEETHDQEAATLRPDLQAEVMELCQNFLSTLKEPKLREVAELKLHGYSNAEIATQLGFSRRSVQYIIVHLKREMLESFA